jgi:hypothetical protein
MANAAPARPAQNDTTINSSSPSRGRPARPTLKTNDEIARSDRADQGIDFAVGIFNEAILLTRLSSAV